MPKRDVDVAEAMLAAWGTWKARREQMGAGYPRRAAFTRTVVQGGFHSTVPLGDLSAARIGDFMAEFRARNGKAWLIAYCHYVGDPALPIDRRTPMPMIDCAARAGCALSTAYAHLKASKQAVKIGVLAIRKNR